MIVNPQLFNYRLIIGSLVIVIIVLGSYTYYNSATLKNQEAFVKQENQLVQNELSKMIDNYKIINVKNDRVTLKLESAKEKFIRIKDSIKLLPNNDALISHYKTKIKAVSEINASNLSLLGAYKDKNSMLDRQLQKETSSKNVILNTSEVILEEVPEVLPLIFLNTALINNKSVALENAISIRNIKVQGVKRITSKNRIITTRTASKANQLHISFTIPQSEVANSNKKNVYIQILDSNNNVVGDKGSVSFGERNLIYSKKAIVNHDNENIKISALIKTNRKEPLIKGSYLVSIFHNATRVANTTITLK